MRDQRREAGGGVGPGVGVARSFPVTVYEPREHSAWADAAGRFQELVPR